MLGKGTGEQRAEISRRHELELRRRLVTKCLCELEDQSLDPRPLHKSHELERWRQPGLWAQLASLAKFVSSRLSERPYLKLRGTVTGEDTPHWSLAFIQMETHIHTPI